jgi:hypothetical protein
MPQPIRLEPWHRLARVIPTYEALAHQAIGPEWEDLTRVVQIAPVPGPPQHWAVVLFDGSRRLREWALPDAIDALDAQKAAERLVLNWGIRDEDVNTEAGVAPKEKAMSLEQPNGFAWARLKKTVVAMFQNPQTRSDGVTVINRLYPGRGTELGAAMVLIERAAENDFMALLDIKAITDAVKGGSEILRPELEKLRTVNEARKEAKDANMAFQAEVTRLATQPGEVIRRSPAAFQAEVNRLALQPSEAIEQSPYERLTA